MVRQTSTLYNICSHLRVGKLYPKPAVIVAAAVGGAEAVLVQRGDEAHHDSVHLEALRAAASSKHSQ